MLIWNENGGDGMEWVACEWEEWECKKPFPVISTFKVLTLVSLFI